MVSDVEKFEKTQPKSRIERRQRQTEQAKATTNEQTATKQPKLRVFPIWLSLLLVIVAIMASLIVGLIVGYGVIGDGEPFDALKVSTWTKIYDLVMKNT